MRTKKSLKAELDQVWGELASERKLNAELRGRNEELNDKFEPTWDMSVMFSAIDRYNSILESLGAADPVCVNPNIYKVYKKYGVKIPQRTVPPRSRYEDR